MMLRVNEIRPHAGKSRPVNFYELTTFANEPYVLHIGLRH